MELSPGTRKEALRLARWALEWHLRGNRVPPPDLTDPVFEEPHGLFVTIHRDDELRGCVGRVDPLTVLREEIPDLALAAATRDPRFYPVTPQEVETVRIEISLLTPPEEVRDVSEIQVGTHGIIVERNGAKGLLLPQVAVEEGWDRNTFLAHACLKAAQPPEAWKDPETRIYRFTAEVFSE
ncbi:MAG: AmmeMemoRadiSam system protein A [Fidelibacterota bacterium]